MNVKIKGCMVMFLSLQGFAMSGTTAANEFEDMEFDSFDETGVPVLVTPTRLKQSKHDIPASVTRIEAAELQDLQIRTIPEVLRYVAGMAVGYASGNQPRINYHGTNGLIPRRMQILIDGMSVYRAGYAEVTWPLLPITIQDVWAIEVTRAPSSPTYGQNSMMAVINIITKDPAQVQEPQLITRYGDQGTRDVYTQFGDSPSESFSYRVSLAKEIDDGFDKNFVGEERRDGTDMNHLNAKAKLNLSEATDLNMFIGFSEGVTELEYRDNQQTTFPDIDNTAQYYQADLRHVFSAKHELKVKSYFTQIDQDVSWTTSQPLALFLPSLRELHFQNSDYAAAIVAGQMPSGGTAQDDALAMTVLQEIASLGVSAFDQTYIEVNEDAVESKFDIEVEDTYILTDSFRFVVGAGATKQSLESETLVAGKAENWGARVFGNGEYRQGKFVLNLGAMIEDEENLDSPELSPRLGLNYRIAPSNTIRYAISRSVRTPDLLETDRDWNYEVAGPGVPVAGQMSKYFYYNAKAENDLIPEEIVSNEIGLYGYHNVNLTRGGVSTLEYDLKVFYDEMKDLVSEKPLFFDYHPTNNTENTLKGAEFELDYFVRGGYLPYFLDSMKIHANYAYLETDTNNFYERSLYARHTGALYSIFYFPNNMHVSLAYYGNSEVNGEPFDGYEIGAGKTFMFNGGSDLSISGKIIYHPDEVNEFTVSETFNVQNNYDDATSLYLTARYSF
ncbi:TonB-dependent receptor plug domain-containing protein [Microbulbifer epialgicus]|uniref:TonB-dependent receptor plug domain-containing protein n=1 Tax=Microbulbifer epialgicus TaxID=393907 RepID=A0ABV4NTV5_9GAMM